MQRQIIFDESQKSDLTPKSKTKFDYCIRRLNYYLDFFQKTQLFTDWDMGLAPLDGQEIIIDDLKKIIKILKTKGKTDA